jgi:integrase/recombinase XerD
MRIFPVKLPSGTRYWTVVDEDFEPVGVADRFLRELRFGRDRAELTTRAHAGAVTLFLRWCAATGRDWRTAATDMGLFMFWLKYMPADGGAVLAGPGAEPVRCASRVNQILAGVRGFLSHAVAEHEAPQWIMGVLYEVGDARDLPMEARGEDSGVVWRARARHRVHEPETPVDRASDEEIVALIRVCRSARDRLIVLLLARAGLRRGEAAGLRRSDIHLLVDSRALGCDVVGAHVHVRRRDNPNGAWAKSRRDRQVPVDFLVVQAFDLYEFERLDCPVAAGSDFVLVNLFRAPVGAPMAVDSINDLVGSLARRAGLTRGLTPHMLRHAFASNIADAGGALDEVQSLLGHAQPRSSSVYLHPDRHRLRAAVQRVPSPRELREALS